MPIKHPQFINGEFYHIITRGIAGQKIFLGKEDYLRYLLNLYRFNNKSVVDPVLGKRKGVSIKFRNGFPIIIDKLEKQKEPLIEILAFCLMPNHVHLLVKQVADNGISLFVNKMGGYSTYFNNRYSRFGSLFQRPFKAIHIESGDQLLTVVTYIHLNPIDLIEFGWKNNGINNPYRVLSFLKTFPWSSYFHYLGLSDLSLIVKPSLLKSILKRSNDLQSFVREKISNKVELKKFLKNFKSNNQ